MKSLIEQAAEFAESILDGIENVNGSPVPRGEWKNTGPGLWENRGIATLKMTMETSIRERSKTLKAVLSDADGKQLVSYNTAVSF